MKQTTPIDWPVPKYQPAPSLLMPLAAGFPAALECPARTDVRALFVRGYALESREVNDLDGFGDARSRFSQLVLPHLPAAYGLARSLTRNPSDAEDVVQEACLRAYRALGGTSVTNARAWLLTIVHNTAYTWLRKNRPEAIIAVDNLESVEQMHAASPASDEATPEAAVIAKADGTQIDAAMQQLPALFRETLVLREIQGLSYREIAEVTGTPIGTVMSRLARARERLISIIGRSRS